MEITRLFDILENTYSVFPHNKEVFGCKSDGKWITYTVEDYHGKAGKLSLGLLALGLEKGDRIATISNNRPEWNFIDMAMSQAGMVHVPIYPTLSESDYTFILGHAEPRLIFVSDKALLQKLRRATEKIKSVEAIYTFNEAEGEKNWKELLTLGEEASGQLREKLSAIRNSIRPEEMATLIYTSGTTGNPKGVMLSHDNILNNLWGIRKIFPFGPEDLCLSFLPISHIYERVINYYFQTVGTPIYYAENMGTISENMREVQPTVFIAVPRVLESIYDKIIGIGRDLKGLKKQIFFWAVNLGMRFELGDRNGWFYKLQHRVADKLIFSKWRAAIGNRCRLVVVGGAALQPRLMHIFNAAGIPLAEGYGMTETSPVIASNVVGTRDIMIGTVGPVLPGVTMKLSDEGEILVKGRSVMLGYYKEPELTRQTIDSEGWLHTGDVGMLIENKFLKITDRKKEIFKLSNGKYVAPQVIENLFKESRFISQLMVTGENEKFASALISPDFEFLRRWCELHDLQLTDKSQMISHPKVVARFQREVNDMNSKLGNNEHIKRFRLVADEWTPQTGELSQTLKLKRRYLFARYKDLLEDIYSVQKT